MRTAPGTGAWHAAASAAHAGKFTYSDHAIEVCLTLRAVFGLPLHQTQGFVRSLIKLLKLSLPVPDFTTLSRRGAHLKLTPAKQVQPGPMTLITVLD
ncbi:transposase [Leisingera methylohalidivorans]|uniref:Transposase DDE domain-containing protein n=1 Tax=Leisingera methylohalidivorans DSM 14336 TaxID=999552 RepID=V9W3C5_9RHOB|nr:transposase [Leisingera methylohalidivorans]AHD03657.1 hypothetical protein METH_22775 [Leisingera methylohalidivorans DSM 14336]